MKLIVKRTIKVAARQSLVWVGAVFVSLALVNYSFAQEDLSQDSVFQDDESDTQWLSGDINFSAFDGGTNDAILGKGELWVDKWGVSAELQKNDQSDIFGLPEDSQFFNLDIKRRFGSRDKSNVELGLGWQELNIDSYLDASGPRVSVSGKLNLFSSSFQVYGLTSYFPELEDSLQNNDATAYEVEAGVLYMPIPNISLKAGYRHFSLDIEDRNIEELGSSSGFLLGTDWSW